MKTSEEWLSIAGQVVVGGYDGLSMPANALTAIAEGTLAGVTFFARNIESAEQLRAQIADLEYPEESPPLLAIDQEGGRVARLKAPVITLPPMRVLGDRDDVVLTAMAGRILGKQLRDIGLTMNFAPVLDVDTNPANPVIGDRSFGRSPDVVIRHALAFAEGLMDSGLLACGKHFPGHGDTIADSHLELPVLKHDRARLDAIELAPFRAALHLPAWMSAHVLFPALSEEVATLSYEVMTVLVREELGYEGCLISDDLQMKAVAARYGVHASAIAAIEAGCDILLICSDLDLCFEVRDALAARAHTNDAFARRLQQAARRSLVLRRAAPPRPQPNLEALAGAAKSLAGQFEPARQFEQMGEDMR